MGISQRPLRGYKRGRCFGSPLLVIEIDCWGFRVGRMRWGIWIVVDGVGVQVSVCVSFCFLVYCVLFFVLGLFPSGDQPPLVLLCVKQAGAELCWGVFLMRAGTALCLVVGLSFGARGCFCVYGRVF